MKDPYGDLFDHFPMQAALGLYTLHKTIPDEEEDEEECDTPASHPCPSRKEASDTCTSRSTTYTMTKDTKP